MMGSLIPSLGLFVPKPSCRPSYLRYITHDLGTTVLQRPLASTAVGGDCYSLGYSAHESPS
jgi:hypothetical protein